MATANFSLLVVGASAGSGKTTRLTKEVIDAVTMSTGDAIPLASIVAVTFTRKAAAELTSRIRREVCKARSLTPADLGAAHIGTVHAVCLRLVREFAMEAGVSPFVDVLPEDEGRLLREVLEQEIPLELHERMTALAERLQIRWDSRVRRHDWVTPIEDIMTLVRSNKIDLSSLNQMAERSLAGLLGLLPPDEADGATLDATIEREVGVALAELRRLDDGQDNTADAIERLSVAARYTAIAEMPWVHWAQLSRLSPGKACKEAVAKVVEVASQYERHPRLRADLREYVRGAFTAARIGLEEFREWKARRRFLDYVDMVDSALALLDVDSVRKELERRFRFVVVDEFQDTSPVQLAFFTRLHRLAGRSVWVGDRKQCIFEYAGADPALMDAALTWCKDSGGRVEQLGFNYRSRPELVEATTAIFESAFASHGMEASEVRVQAHREIPPATQALAPFGLWLLEAKNDLAEADAVAVGVARLLSRPRDTIVVDKDTRSPRAVRPGDIAILVATNDEGDAIANALERAGVPAALPRQGLLGTPEGVFMSSALEYLSDGSSSLAKATLESLLGVDGLSPDRWLNQLLAPKSKGDANVAEASRGAGPRALTILDELRPRIEALSPKELVEIVIARTDLPKVCARWPDSAQRLGNLDAFRALARAYEQRCQHEHEEASVAGLLRFLKAASTPTLRRDEMRPIDHQYVRSGEDSVTICTYHRAKGLEWPIVVMCSLDRSRRRSPFEVTPESDQSAFDPDAPLAGRWVRYWPWPLGQLRTVPLGSVAARSPEGRRVAENELRERTRLLYVGFTRARDHLVLAARIGKNGPKTRWLDEMSDANGRPLVHLPRDPEEGRHVEITRPLEETLKVPTRVWRLSSDIPAKVAPAPTTSRWFSRPNPDDEPRPSFWIAPSRAAMEWPGCGEFDVGEIVRLGEGVAAGLNLPTEEWPRLGTAVHMFFAADDDELPDAERLALARRLIASAELSKTISAEALLKARDGLQNFIRGRWPGCRIHREIPISAPAYQGQQRRQVRGSIDVLVESSEGCVVIDHKTFPGIGESAWRSHARDHGTQVVAYLRALSTVPGVTPSRGWIHFVVSGTIVEIVPAKLG
jgi:ATP-dependent exoDNAse (exonuclease V) beta subunit